MADAQRHTVKMKFDLPQGVSAPGMYVKVLVPDLTSPGHEAPIIPTSAIRYNGSLPAVYVIGEDGRIIYRTDNSGWETEAFLKRLRVPAEDESDPS